MEGEVRLTHLHITAWALAIILLFVVTALYRQDKARPGKILHMVLRLIYLVVIGTGIALLFSGHNYDGQMGELVIKVIAGLWTVVAIELITVRTSKGQAAGSWWIQFAIVAIIAIVLGFGRLTNGIQTFLF